MKNFSREYVLEYDLNLINSYINFILTRMHICTHTKCFTRKML